MPDPLQVSRVDDFHNLIRIDRVIQERGDKRYQHYDHGSGFYQKDHQWGMGGAFHRGSFGLRVPHEAVTAAWSGWEERGFRKETRPYLPRRFLAHSLDGPGLRIRLDPCRVVQQRPDGYSRWPQK